MIDDKLFLFGMVTNSLGGMELKMKNQQKKSGIGF